MERERDVEKYLRMRVLKHGGLYYKFVSPGNDGGPDRVIILKGRVYFVELKREGEKPRPVQEWQISQMRMAGADVRVIAGRKEAEAFVDEIVEGGDR